MDLAAQKTESIPSLEKICLTFIAVNIESLDSLEGFPIVVGESLINKCMEDDVFSSYSEEQQLAAIDVFVTAYKSQMISRFKLFKEDIRLFNYLPQAFSCTFRHITDLDMSCCGLKDEDLLCSFSSLEALQRLNLSGNFINDSGFRKLLTRFKVLKKGFEHIKELNITGNLIPNRYLTTLLNFPSLQKLQFSQEIVQNTEKKIKPSGFQFMAHCIQRTDKDLLKLLQSQGFEVISAPVINDCGLQNEGKIVDVVRKWLNNYHYKKASSCPTKSKNTSFYGKKCVRLPIEERGGGSECEDYSVVRVDLPERCLGHTYSSSYQADYRPSNKRKLLTQSELSDRNKENKRMKESKDANLTSLQELDKCTLNLLKNYL